MDKVVKHEKVVDAFVSAIRETKEKLDVLDAYIDDYMDASFEAVKWADVNTAKHVSDMLDEIIAFCNIPNTKQEWRGRGGCFFCRFFVPPTVDLSYPSQIYSLPSVSENRFSILKLS